MPTTVKVLSGVLIVQILLAAILFWSDQQAEFSEQNQALVAFDASAVDRMVIGGEGSDVTLVRQGGIWLVDGETQLPTPTGKAAAVVTQLASVQRGWPVAATESSQSRFEVGDDSFQRHIQAYQGDKVLADVFLGSSPSFRQVHARLAGESDIFSVKLANFDFPSAADDWLDHSLLAAPQPVEIRGSKFTLSKTDAGWQAMTVDGVKVEADSSSLQQWVDRFKNLSVLGVAAKAPAESESVEYALTDADNKVVNYSFAHTGDQYLVRSGKRPEWFTIDKVIFDAVQMPAFATDDTTNEVSTPEIAVPASSDESAEPQDPEAE